MSEVTKLKQNKKFPILTLLLRHTSSSVLVQMMMMMMMMRGERIMTCAHCLVRGNHRMLERENYF